LLRLLLLHDLYLFLVQPVPFLSIELEIKIRIARHLSRKLRRLLLPLNFGFPSSAPFFFGSSRVGRDGH
jgi:hypothetical protein